MQLQQGASAMLIAAAAAALVACGGIGGAPDPAEPTHEAATTPCADRASSPAGRVTPRQARAAQRGRYEVFGGEPVTLRPPVDWDEDPLGARRYQQNLHKLRYLDPLLVAHAADGGRPALRQAADLAVDWVRSNPPPGPGDPDRIEWTDKVAADRVPYLAYIRRAAACEELLSRRESNLLRGSLRRHGSFLADDGNYEDDNHGLFVDLGLLRLVQLAPGLPEASEWRRLAVRRFARTLRSQSPEGLWLEHSTAYQLLVIRPLERMIEALGDDPAAERLRRRLERMREAAAWMVRPDGQLVQFGDSNLERVPGWARRMATEVEGLRLYERSGMAFVRGGGGEPDKHGYLAVTAGHHSAKHKHQDDLSFELHDRGVRIVADTGLFHKDVGRMRDFVLAADSHSVLTVDGEQFPIPPARDAYGSGIDGGSEGDGWSVIAGTNPLLEERGVEHRRLFAYLPGQLLLVLDRVSAGSVHAYQRHLHLGPRVRVRPAGAGLALQAPGLRGRLRPLGPAPERIETARGEREPMRGWTSPDFRELEPRWSIRLDNAGSDELLGLAIELGPRAPRAAGVRESANGIEVRLRRGDAASRLKLALDGSSVNEEPSPGSGNG